jgi:tRNA pseudouridine55 synthase
MARKGQDVELQPRTVSITTFEITAIKLPEVKFKIVCSKGTYIRSIARDFGEALGVGAYLSSLCRTRIGEFLLSDALEIEQVI